MYEESNIVFIIIDALRKDYAGIVEDKLIKRGFIKYENAINRITSRVEYGLRDSERVLPGTVFDVEVVYRVFDVDTNGADLSSIKSLGNLPDPLKKRLGLIIKGMKLLEEDYLGGCGTRGYGKVKFENFRVEVLPIDYFVRGDKPIKIFEGELREAKI